MTAETEMVNVLQNRKGRCLHERCLCCSCGFENADFLIGVSFQCLLLKIGRPGCCARGRSDHPALDASGHTARKKMMWSGLRGTEMLPRLR